MRLIAYEIDFLVDFVYGSDAFAANPEACREWLSGMAAAALDLNVTVQYCTATGFDVLQSLEFPAVTNVRTSMDYRDYPNHYVGPAFLLAWALGLKPSKDVRTHSTPFKMAPKTLMRRSWMQNTSRIQDM